MPHSDPDVRMLASALDLTPNAIAFHSREPLGEGSVTGLRARIGEDELLYFLDTSALSVPAETGLATADGAIRIWQHPADPHLPALAPVAFEHAAKTVLARLGITGDAVPEMVSYRPGRRAVLRVVSGDGPVWLKVVRPSRVEGIIRAGAAVAAAGLPVPHVHGWSDEGLIVMAGAVGTPAADVDWEPGDLLVQVDAAREVLAHADWRRRSTGILGRLAWYGARAGEQEALLLTEAGTLIDASVKHRAEVVVHGDLHFGQIFLSDGRISGIIDVDTLALGDPAEDPAAFLSHAIVSALLTEAPSADRVWSLADVAALRWGQDTRVRALAVIHLVGHAIAARERGEHERATAIAQVATALLRGSAPSTGRA